MRVGAISLLAGACLAAVVADPIQERASPLEERASTFTNPVLYEDYPDLDAFRVGNVFYYSSSSFAYSPGAPLLKSYDLVNWSPVTHSVPRLDFSSKYNLNSATDRAYVKGIWASSVRYRASNDMWYWIGCIEFSTTYIYTSSGSGAGSNNGEASSWNWKLAATLSKCYYDCGLLIDDDDTMYVAYGSTNLYVAQLASNGLSEVKSAVAYASGGTYIEGSRMYKIKGYYWIFPTKPASGEWVLRASSPWGPYTQKVLFDSLSGPLSNAGYAHQGGVVETAAGNWYYMAFMDAYPNGRIPVLAPITWSSDTWPTVVLSSGSWPSTGTIPVTTSSTVSSVMGADLFTGSALSNEWEWNHNPDTTKFSISNGVTMQTATITTDIFTARNTLTHRCMGPKSVGTFTFDISKMTDGDRAGAAFFRDQTAYVGIHQSGSTRTIVFFNNAALDSSWATSNVGSVAATGPTVTGSIVYFRITADTTPAFGLSAVRQALFSYSTDGSSWTQLGSITLSNNWTYFTGFRYAAFNFATKALGGQVTLKRFAMEYPSSLTSPIVSTTTTTSSTTTSHTTTTTTSHTTTSSTTTTSHTTSTTTTSSSGSCQTLYGQCGGINWTGATCCSSGTCKYGNDYYYQCLS